MRRIVHISDLHFGRTRPELLEPLLCRIATLDPDLVAVSGDLTQRARAKQFAEARAFLDRLDARWIAVPGNHDVPLYNVTRRILDPYRNYRRTISKDLEPSYTDAEIVVTSVNTVDPFSWQRGRISSRDIRRACGRVEGCGNGRTSILVVHHPFMHLPGEPKALMRGARSGIRAAGRNRVDVVLAGHLHAWRVEPVAARLDSAHTIQVQAGTGLSTRQRGEENDFNLLTIDAGSIVVDRYAADEDLGDFRPAASRRFLRAGSGWVPAQSHAK
jgi:3',5'-cyclic AMP phosphodiesterase CpdA